MQVSALGTITTAAGAAAAQEKAPGAEPAPDSRRSFKATREQAGYIERDHPSTQDCSTCHSYIEPAECQLIEGPVSPWGWCTWFSD
jgi:hypothetical protein